MPKKRLTEEGVAKLKPPPAGKQIDYFDAVMPRLVLRVNYGGAKVWRALYYLKRIDKNGRRTTVASMYKLGRYPHLKLKEAREAARKFIADPQGALAKGDAGSFKEVAQNFIKRHVEASKLRSQPEIERCLNKYVYPYWQDRPFAELRRADVAALLDRVQDNHGARQADIVLAIIRKITHWYQARNDSYISPVVRGMNRNNNTDRKRKRILDDGEIRALFKAADDCGTFGALVKVLLLTGQRLAKVGEMKWADVVDGEWRIATAVREKGNPGVLKLPQAVQDIIAAQPRIAGNPYVFAGRGDTAFNAFSQRKHELEAKLPAMEPFVLHDLRRSARSLMSRAGVRPDIAERVLGHAIAGVEGVYDRHSYADEKADALNRLAALIESIINPQPPSVVDLARVERLRAARKSSASV